MTVLFDAVSALARIKISGQIATEVAALSGAGVLERVKIAGRIAALLAQLGEGAAPTIETITLTGQEFGEYPDTPEGLKALRDAAFQHYLNELVPMGGIFCRALDAQVEFNKRGLKKFASLSGDRRKIKIVAALPELIATGRKTSEMAPSDKAVRSGVAKAFVLKADVSIGGEAVTARIIVHERADGTFTYDHSVDKSEAVKVTGGSSGALDSVVPTEQGRSVLQPNEASLGRDLHRQDLMIDQDADGDNALDGVAGTEVLNLFLEGEEIEQASERLKNFGWDAVKLSDYSLEQLAELRRQVEAEHANPFDEQSRYTENGQPTIHLYDAKGRKKLDALAWAVTYRLQEASRAEVGGSALSGMPHHWREKLLSQAEAHDIVLPEQVQAQLDAHEGMFDSPALRGEASEEDIQEQAKAITSANFSKETQHKAKLESANSHSMEMRKAVDLLALSRTLVAIGTRKNAQAPDGFTGVGTPYFQAAERYTNAATAALASARGIAAFLAAMERRLAKTQRPSTTSFDKHLTQLVTPPALDLPTVEHDGDTWYILNTGTQREDGKVFAHLSSTTRGRQAANGVQPIQANDYIELPAKPEPEGGSVASSQHEIIEHVTGRGKTLRGIVRTDLSYADAKAIDEYTFKKDGGYFIREKHLESMGLPPAPPAPAEPLDPIRQAELDAEREQLRLQAEADRLANEQARQRQKLEQQVSKLRSVAASTLEKAEQELGRDRLANTSRRAAMAASGLAAAERSRALALTMNNLADAIERGQAQHLAGVSSRADVETLMGSLATARANYERSKGMTYAEQMKHKEERYSAEEARHAEMPRPRWDNAGASRAKVLDLIKGKRGAPALSKKIMYATFIEPEDVKALRAMVGQKEANEELGWYSVELLAKVERLRRAGITTNVELRDALVEFLEFREGARAEDPIAKAERAIIGQKVGIDFFPTPKALAARMADLAGIREGDRVLEPSAGNGNLADAAKAAGGQVDVIEISSQLRDILEAKGYEVVAHDFDAFTPSEPYNAVIMNPPFGKGAARLDAQHLMRAFGMLKPGGKLVGIAGEGVFFGTDAKAVAFRKWLDDHGADIEPLGQNTFKDTQLLATTGANARLIVMHK